MIVICFIHFGEYLRNQEFTWPGNDCFARGSEQEAVKMQFMRTLDRGDIGLTERISISAIVSNSMDRGRIEISYLLQSLHRISIC